MTNASFHLTFSPPAARLDGKPDPWPNGCWSVYEITGDEIARRIAYDDAGRIARRDPWPGFVACFDTLDAATDAIRKRMEASQ